MKPIGTVIGSVAEGCHEQDHAKTPESSSYPTSRGFASSYEIGQNPSLKPMTIVEAAEMVDKLLRNYPNLNAHDPGGYIMALGEIMEAFPKWAAERAILSLSEQNPDFPPTGPRLRITLAEIVRPHLFKKQWEARNAKQLAERKANEETATPAQPSEEPRGQIYDHRSFDEAVAKHGRPIGVFENDRGLIYRG